MYVKITSLALLVFIFFHPGAADKGFQDILGAMNWPCEDAVLVHNFGYNDRGRPVLGMVFSGNTEVLSVERGEVIFSSSKDNTVSRLPSPLGAWTAVDHGDGLISIYSRYDDGDSRIPASVERQQPIAITGISGWSSQNGFYFMVFDRRERRWVNPAMIITPRQDVNPPQIISMELRNEQGLPVSSRNITQGRYTIFVNAASFTASRTNRTHTALAPQRIVCLVNGAEAGSLNFEDASARDGILMVHRNGLVSAKQVYANSPAFEIAEVFLNRGQANVEIIVYDLAGNSRSEISRLVVN